MHIGNEFTLSIKNNNWITNEILHLTCKNQKQKQKTKT